MKPQHTQKNITHWCKYNYYCDQLYLQCSLFQALKIIVWTLQKQGQGKIECT